MEYKVLIVGGTYHMQPDGRVQIELFGRDDKARSMTVRYQGFDPYFYIVEPPVSITDQLRKDPEVLNVEEKMLNVDQVDRKCLKVTIKKPFEVPKFRRRLENYCRILAADIPFVHRFYYDLDLSSCVTVVGKEVEAEGYTTDLVVDAEKIEKTEHFKIPLKTLSFDIENSMISGEIFTICLCVRDCDGTLEYEVIQGDEKHIIETFIGSVARNDPDVLTGYNIDGYDIPYIQERAAKYRLKLKLARDHSEVSQVSNRFWRSHGRIIADAWWNVKKEIRPKRETLDAVASELLGKQKLDVDRSSIDKEWEKDKDAVIEYCKFDALLALEILEKIRSLEKAQDLAAVSDLPIDDVLNGRTSTLIDSIFVREADKRGIGVPLTQHRRKDKKITGGYVHEVDPGLYHWVCVLDFRSMYPSVIIENNLCFTTLNEKGEIMSPTGASFFKKETKPGLLPEILADIMEQRLELKKQMKEAKDEKQRAYFNGLQEAVKILMNSFYGVFASAFYRFTDPRIGESITAFSREAIKNIIKELEDRNIKVIYSDTDSIFFRSPHDDLEKTREFGMSVADEYSKGAAVLEFEKIMEPFFTHGKKKRYVGKIVWPKEEILVRGYETRRTDSFDLQSESLEELFKLVLSDQVPEALKFAQETVKETMQGNVPIEKLVISKTVQDESYYSTESKTGTKLDLDRLPNIQAARKLREMGEEVTPGMKVSWIVTDSRRSPMEVDPYRRGHSEELRADYKYYAERLALSISRVTDVFGYDEKRLITGSVQHSLFSDAFESFEPQSKDEERRPEKGKGPVKKKKVSLDDFL